MSSVECTFKGLTDHGSEFMRWIAKALDSEFTEEILEDIGKEGVAESQKFIAQNKVKPPTSKKTLEQRRKGKDF